MVWQVFKTTAKGPILALIVMTILHFFVGTAYQPYVPFPISVLSVMIIYSVFHSGILSGMISSAVTITYFYYFLEATLAFSQNRADAWNRLISWSIALPIIVLFVGVLKRRSLDAATFRERNRHEMVLTEINHRNEMILENLPGVIWAVDQNGIFTLSRGSALPSVGLKSGERIGTSIFDLYDSAHVVTTGTKKALRGVPSQETFKINDFWFDCHFSATRDLRGKITGVVGVATDVTSRMESESAKAQLEAVEKAANQLRESEAKFKGAFEHSPIGIGLSFANGVWFDVNPAICQMLGYVKEELIGKNISDITFRADQHIGEALHTSMLKGEIDSISFEKRYLHKNSQAISFWVNGSVVRNETGAPLYILCQMVDVTERRRAEKELRETTRKFQTLINTSPVAIIALDENDQVTLWNPACQKMFGWTVDEVMGKFLPFVPQSKRSESKKIIEQIHATREAVHFEADRITKSGSAIKARTAAIPLLNDQNKIIGLMAVMIDNTERHKAEQELIESNRALRIATQAKSEFLANMSHEIRTPINGVMGMTSLLLDLKLGSEQRNYAETIQNSASILLTLVNDILDFSKIEAGKLTLEKIHFDLESVTSNIVNLLSGSAIKKGIRFTQTIAPELLQRHFLGDPTRISQILCNLISNSIKFTEAGHIEVSITTDSSIFFKGDSSLMRLRVEVTDTGIGLSDESLARMFQPFTQADASTNRRFGGTGLGLSICKNLVELMGGEIGVKSVEGKGSTFWFTLTLEKSSEQHQSFELKSGAKFFERSERLFRVLVAEDNPVNQVITVRMLEKNGFKVDVVSNGEEAVLAAHTVPYDFVLMDCQMPKMDGYEATAKIRTSVHPKVSALPIIAMTANALSGDREKCLEAGMNDYISKPVKVQDLLSVIYKNLIGRSAA